MALLKASVVQITHLLDRQEEVIKTLTGSLVSLKQQLAHTNKEKSALENKVDNLIAFSYVSTAAGLLYILGRFGLSLLGHGG